MNLSKHKKSFGKVSGDYQQYRKSYDPKLYKLLSKLLKNKRNIRVLDIGCGTGKSTFPLLKISKNIEVVGVDHDLQMLKEAKDFAQKNDLPILYKRGLAEKLPFPKGSFDVVVSGTAFHWFATNKAMREIKRVLKPGGLLFIFWNMERKTDKPTIGLSLYKKYKWKPVPTKLRDLGYIKSLLVKNGIKNIKTLTIPFIRKYNLEEYVGGLKTASAYALMTKVQKASFTQEMEEAFRREVKGKIYKINKEVRVCYGTV